MKNLVKLVGIIVFVIVIGLSFSACKSDPVDDLHKTTWKAVISDATGTTTITCILAFHTPDFTLSGSTSGGGISPKPTDTIVGKYSVTGDKVTLTWVDGGVTETDTGTFTKNKLTFTNGTDTVEYTKQ